MVGPQSRGRGACRCRRRRPGCALAGAGRRAGRAGAEGRGRGASASRARVRIARRGARSDRPGMIAFIHLSWYGSPAWNFARHVVLGYNALVFFYVVFVDLTYLAFTFIALIEVRRYLRTRDKERLEQIFRSRLVPPISILCPAYNEGATIVDSVRSLLRLKYSQHEVVVVNDGSKDNTLASLIEAFRMEKLEFEYETTVPSKP